MGNCTSSDTVGTGPSCDHHLPTSYGVNDQPPPSMPVQTIAKEMTSSPPPNAVYSRSEALGPSPQVVYRPVPIVYSGATMELCCGGHCVMVKYPGGKCQSNCIDCYGGDVGLVPKTNEVPTKNTPVCTK